ncbi:MAG: type II secretion system protein [Helicobacteraceae bacterium]
MKKQGFTLIELIFVIVVLGIIGSITASVIARLFESYVIQRSILKTELAIQNFYDTMDNYLSNSITQSISIRNGEFTADDSSIKDGFRPIYEIETRSDGDMTDPKNKRALLWISKDIQSLQGIWNDAAQIQEPGYNTVADIEKSKDHQIYSPNLNTNMDNIRRLVTAYKTGSEQDYKYDVGIFFPYGNLDGRQYDRFWKPAASSIFLIVELMKNYEPGLDMFQLSVADLAYKPKEIGDVFNLSSMASGIYYNIDNDHPENNQTIRLVWDFVPWGANIHYELKATEEGGGSSSSSGWNFPPRDIFLPFKFNHAVGKKEFHDFVMLEHVTKFQVWSESGGSIIRMFLCVGDPKLRRFVKPDFEVCKESVILK